MGKSDTLSPSYAERDALSRLADGLRRFWRLLPLTLALSFVLSWPVAVLLILSEVVHEASHLMTARRFGVRDEGIVFSFLRGGVLLDMEHASPKETWMIAIAGPASGAVLALVCLALHAASGAEVFTVSAFWIAVPVLLNLVPIFGTDGKMIIGIIADSVRSRGGRVLSRSDVMLATISLIVTTAVLATISLSAYSVLGGSVLPLRFSF